MTPQKFPLEHKIMMKPSDRVLPDVTVNVPSSVFEIAGLTFFHIGLKEYLSSRLASSGRSNPYLWRLSPYCQSRLRLRASTCLETLHSRLCPFCHDFT